MSGEYVVEVTEATFSAEVLDYSMKTPVLIDFWAQWCAPCKTLGPILETIVDQYQGAIRLAKVDVDGNQQLAQAVRIQSVPTVVVIFQGSMVDQFTGALPNKEVERFVDDVMTRIGISRPPPAETVPTDPAAAEVYWTRKLDEPTEKGKARYQLGQLALSKGDSDAAKSFFQQIEASEDEYSDAQASLRVLELSAFVAQAGGEVTVRERLAADPTDGQARYLVACLDACQGRFTEALLVLIDLVASREKAVHEDAKKAATIVLSAAGRGDEEVEALRRRLSLLLF